MQYGVNVFPYERVSKIKKEGNAKKTENFSFLLRAVLVFFITFLSSRVNVIDSIAPCGLAFLISILFYVEDLFLIIPCLGCAIGYISIHNSVNEIGRYLMAVSIITIVFYSLKNLSKTKKIFLSFALVFLDFIFYKLFILQKPLNVSFLYSFLELACIFPLYFIIDKSIICFKNLSTKHLFSSEELLTMAICISIVIAGTYGFKIKTVSITNVLALNFIIVLSYVCGSSIGAASGVAIGAIIGMNAHNIGTYVAIYGLCALVSGAFKEMGKWFTALSCIITFLIVVIYSKDFQYFKMIEPMISCAVFLAIPNKYYEKLCLEINRSEKEEYVRQDYVYKIKDIFMTKINNFSDVLYDMSKILTSLSNNNLELKDKSTTLVENLADRTCSNCNMKAMCWKREMHYTYSAFEELIEGCQNGKKVIPEELDKKCVNLDKLLLNTKEIVNNYIIERLINKKFSEGRKILSEQISNMSNSLNSVVNEIGCNINFNVFLEKNIMRSLNKENIKYSDIMCFTNKKGKIVVKLKMKNRIGKQTCIKDILPLIEDVTQKTMCIEEEGCYLDPKDDRYIITFKEIPKYYVTSYARGICKDGEECNGDSYNFGKGLDENYMILLSDGMGSGPEASDESGAVVKLIRKLINSGFDETTAINAVNSIMSLRFYEDEKFSTVDLGNINLYNGKIKFVKVGAAATFIKRGNDVKTIKSRSLPIGILDNVDPDIKEYKLENGDLIIMVSDGIIDYNNENVGNNHWIVDYLEEIGSNNPKQIADELIQKSIELSDKKVRDDMTVIVSKVYNVY